MFLIDTNIYHIWNFENDGGVFIRFYLHKDIEEMNVFFRRLFQSSYWSRDEKRNQWSYYNILSIAPTYPRLMLYKSSCFCLLSPIVLLSEEARECIRQQPTSHQSRAGSHSQEKPAKNDLQLELDGLLNISSRLKSLLPRALQFFLLNSSNEEKFAHSLGHRSCPCHDCLCQCFGEKPINPWNLILKLENGKIVLHYNMMSMMILFESVQHSLQYSTVHLQWPFF